MLTGFVIIWITWFFGASVWIELFANWAGLICLLAGIITAMLWALNWFRENAIGYLIINLINLGASYISTQFVLGETNIPQWGVFMIFAVFQIAIDRSTRSIWGMVHKKK